MRSLRILVLLALSAGAGACASVPFDYPKDHSVAIASTTDTALAREVSAWVEAHGGESGFYPLIHGMDALGARLYLIGKAEASVDLQYFLMKDDLAGRLFAAALLRAADRGVRVRFLLDDVFTTIPDKTLARLDGHENIEVRLFNPVARGGVFHLNFLADFRRANRRMHNKSFVADNQVAIVGGRNIADEYFELRTDGEFLDFDLLGVGPVASEVSDTFDRFWNHSRSVPIAALVDEPEQQDVDAWRRNIEEQFRNADQTVYSEAVNTTLVQALVSGARPLYPGAYDVVTDDPDKIVTPTGDAPQDLVAHLADVVAAADREVLLVTPYFVPLDTGVAYWKQLAADDLRIVILTNSLASTNHTAVHSAYAKYRRAIVEAGIELYETRVDAVEPSAGQDSPESVTLHSKAIILDRETLFAGSLNLDPRSIEINAEVGILVYSPEMVGELAGVVLDDLDTFAYRVTTDDDGALNWTVRVGDEQIVETREPQTSLWTRIKAFFLRIVPDRQL